MGLKENNNPKLRKIHQKLACYFLEAPYTYGGCKDE